ncbi:unnamed protein product [Clonostachys byssicola]|uniref:glutathione transferase n=1 Tax=Clonostachys byssicola TaxID=160290 RepID=A0A9N9UNJ1_9HYPO|nr:unnamed protein product [Clonostachys byssicola]
MSDIKPITIWAHGVGPNPIKVLIILEELGIPYEKIEVENPKAEEYTKINPNGRVPTIFDPNTDLTLWESGAIIEYLVETYDKEGKLTVKDAKDKWHLKQYLHFQMSGQGPYFGQAVWFHRFHPEDVPSAKTRYEEQVTRVLGVLDNILKDKEYLVANKLTYADLAFVPWSSIVTAPQVVGPNFREKYEVDKKYPNFLAWHERVSSRPSVARARGEKK